MRIEGLAAIVTGGASGLGEATARTLAAAGAKVTLLDRDATRGPKVAGEIGGVFAACDVTDPASVDSALAAGAAAHGAARIAVNCAGIALGQKTINRDKATGAITPHALDAYARVVQINLIGTFIVASRAAAAMAALPPVTGDGGRGVIVMTASVAAEDGQIGQLAYAASKGGVVGMTLPVARDLAAIGVRVNTVAPGLIDTPIYGQGEGSEAFKQNLQKGVLFPQRLGFQEELASMVVECVTNSYMNAETIRVDGGIRMQPK